MIPRRDFLRGALIGTATAVAMREASAQEVANSAGTARPKLQAPPHACDCHLHIYDPERFPLVPNPKAAPKRATLREYRVLQRRIGVTRAVIVTPRNYGTKNSATADAIAQLSGAARGIAVLHPDVADAELKMLDKAGIRGVRFSLTDPASAVVTPAMIEPLAKRVADLGWHIQFNVSGEQILEFAPVLSRLPLPMVFDHMANPPLPAGVNHASHAFVRKLIDKGRTWVKLSGAYANSRVGPPSYPEATAIARAFIKAAPERLVWGSDWPHPSLPEGQKPDDAVLFDLLSDWAPDAATRNRILVRNPEALYRFEKSA